MSDGGDDQLLVPLGCVLCPSGRLTIVDWVMVGDWPPEPGPRGLAGEQDEPRVVIQEHSTLRTAAAVVDGLPRDVAFPVLGNLIGEGLWTGRLRCLVIVIREGVAASRTVIGDVPVDYGLMVAVDAAVDLAWDTEISIDGLADVAFWGRDQAAVAAEVGAGPMLAPGEHNVFGWRDLPIDDALSLARDLEAMRSDGKRFAVDFRPHTEQWRNLEDLRQSPNGSIEVEYHGSRLLMFELVWGTGIVVVSAELDSAGHLLRVILDLDQCRDPFKMIA